MKKSLAIAGFALLLLAGGAFFYFGAPRAPEPPAAAGAPQPSAAEIAKIRSQIEGITQQTARESLRQGAMLQQQLQMERASRQNIQNIVQTQAILRQTQESVREIKQKQRP